MSKIVGVRIDEDNVVDMFGQLINVDDYVCCTSSSASTGMYIGKISKISPRKVTVIGQNGSKHLKNFSKVFVVTEQMEYIPELMIGG